jgi:hypothetical protein
VTAVSSANTVDAVQQVIELVSIPPDQVKQQHAWATQQSYVPNEELSIAGEDHADEEDQDEIEQDTDVLGISDEGVGDVDIPESSQESDHPSHIDASHAPQALMEHTSSNKSTPRPCNHHTATEPPFVFPDGYQDTVPSRSTAPLDRLTAALATWTAVFSVSTAAYKALAEILKSVDDLDILRTLPLSISTLNDRLNHQLPIPRLVSKDVPLNLEKLANTDHDHGPIYLFDQRESIKDTIETTSLRCLMHFGWGEIPENRSELWHGAAWWESMRASAVGYAHGEHSQTWPCYKNGTPILFSDIVSFSSTEHGLGRIRGMAIDRRANSPTKTKLVAIVEQLVRCTDLPETLRPKSLGLDNLVLIEKPVLYVDVGLIHTKMDLVLDGTPLHLPTEDISEPRPVLRQTAQAAEATASMIEALRSTDTAAEESTHIIAPVPLNRVAYIVDLEKPSNSRSIRLRHPLRGELELKAFGRDHIINCFLLNPLPVVTLPLIFFTDGFGTYRNSYRSLLAVYTGIANLPEQERRRLHNLKLLTVGPFGSSLTDVIRALAPAGKALDRGMILDLHIGNCRMQSYVCAYQFLHTSDLPQQNDSSGTLRQNATYGCRLCLINKDYRDDLNYNVCLHGRYQMEMERAREAVSSTARTRRVDLLGRLGLAEEVSPWTIISPAINQFEMFSLDVCHSEGSGKCHHRYLYTNRC